MTRNNRLAGLTLEESPEELAEKEASSRRAAQKAEQERKYQEKLQREEETQLEEVYYFPFDVDLDLTKWIGKARFHTVDSTSSPGPSRYGSIWRSLSLRT